MGIPGKKGAGKAGGRGSGLRNGQSAGRSKERICMFQYGERDYLSAS